MAGSWKDGLAALGAGLRWFARGGARPQLDARGVAALERALTGVEGIEHAACSQPANDGGLGHHVLAELRSAPDLSAAALTTVVETCQGILERASEQAALSLEAPAGEGAVHLTSTRTGSRWRMPALAAERLRALRAEAERGAAVRVEYDDRVTVTLRGTSAHVAALLAPTVPGFRSTLRVWKAGEGELRVEASPEPWTGAPERLEPLLDQQLTVTIRPAQHLVELWPPSPHPDASAVEAWLRVLEDALPGEWRVRVRGAGEHRLPTGA
ncbi:hypothetical protein [uncultured Tessaracoccus sp.]|uniref:hypothetical protein n=1 Tax=uncultured Tessaracoccus sp. TaxID=905023 RepID=UPI0025CDB53B|nr:hypothetical protein [uncultured Tessaracoccus sp.]